MHTASERNRGAAGAAPRGDCYEAAFRLILPFGPVKLSTAARLVHGLPTLRRPPFGRFGHAWVEDGETVFDYSNGQELRIPRDLYYALGQIESEENVYYQRDEAIRQAIRSGVYGPWHDEPDIQTAEIAREWESDMPDGAEAQ